MIFFAITTNDLSGVAPISLTAVMDVILFAIERGHALNLRMASAIRVTRSRAVLEILHKGAVTSQLLANILRNTTDEGLGSAHDRTRAQFYFALTACHSMKCPKSPLNSENFSGSWFCK